MNAITLDINKERCCLFFYLVNFLGNSIFSPSCSCGVKFEGVFNQDFNRFLYAFKMIEFYIFLNDFYKNLFNLDFCRFFHSLQKKL